MKGIKKTIGTSISIFLLLCFSVTVLPLDAFHNHPDTKIGCSDSRNTQTCQHKHHVSTKSAFCWVCAVHFDKSFTGKSIIEKIADSPAVSLFTENEITGYFVEQLFTLLRGPPLN
jgi:hypothetical protein